MLDYRKPQQVGGSESFSHLFDFQSQIWQRQNSSGGGGGGGSCLRKRTDPRKQPVDAEQLGKMAVEAISQTWFRRFGSR